MVMENLYFFCAVFGSVFVIAQFVLALFAGLDGDADGSDSAGDDAFAASDATHSSGVFDQDPSQNVQIGESHSAISFVKILSIRTLTAGIAFFGLIGMAGTEAKLFPFLTFLFALACGFGAIYLVYSLYRFIYSFRYDGSVKRETLIGAKGDVYLRIPAARSGIGNVMVNHQGRSMNYEALTDETTDLTTGTPIIVIGVLTSTQVLVGRLTEESKGENGPESTGDAPSE